MALVDARPRQHSHSTTTVPHSAAASERRVDVRVEVVAVVDGVRVDVVGVQFVCEVATLVEFREDVAAADELALDERLRGGLPAAVALEGGPGRRCGRPVGAPRPAGWRARRTRTAARRASPS